ncbi:caspase family protein [Pedobacter polysacchareus]|uniref:caspase family protein n=1 Tax=Pedobacter polysacchareus TaxID=2861973 RepID=UPI001C9905DC|nr:caspase family protein [Pedobacter polysacchareus]
MMNALALIVGNTNYVLKEHELINAVNDSDDLAEKLMTLGFTIQKVTNCTRKEFDDALIEFGDNLKKYQIGLFYFSGHGLQIDGLNYLTSIDTSFADSSSAKYTSNRLDEVIERMQNANPIIKILILDACRNNPLQSVYRGTTELGLAPIHAPKGTIIAFSTSPGEKAMDYGSGRNSIYTGSLLKHIDDPNIPIEDFFKRVRTSVYNLSRGKQTSWEHTSLIGNFYFNSGQLVHSVELQYKREFVADHLFKSTGSDIDTVIEDLRSHDWYKQNSAIEKILTVAAKGLDDSSEFILGRNILQTAIGGEFSAQGIMKNLATWLVKFDKDGGNHVLNGMLFEMYFDSKGLFRKGKLKSYYVDELYALQTDQRYFKSFEFIKQQLLPFKFHLFYLPSIPPEVLAIEAIVTEHEDLDILGNKVKGYKLESLKHETIELLQVQPHGQITMDEISLEKFKETLKLKLCVPSDKLTLSTSVPEKQIKYLSIPWRMHLSRESLPAENDSDF